MPTVQHDEKSLTIRFESLDELSQHAPILAEGADPLVRMIFRGTLDSFAREGLEGRGPVTIVARPLDVRPDEDERWEVAWEVAD